jgi:2-succinyl-6-hydroxy-2,4-cyclohexadiene-1-carboxylate synthase
VHADLWSGADLLSAAVEPHLHGAPADWIGYSMGGRYCLHVALSHPEQVRRLVLVSATGGIDDEHERARRRQGDEALANRVEEIGVEAFLQQWLSQPLFATLPPHAAGIEARLDSTASGLASSLRLAGTGTQDPLWDRLGTLAMPVLIVAGELDHKYVQLGRRLVEAIGDNAELAVIDGAGHACHLEQPDRFLALVAPFLADG